MYLLHAPKEKFGNIPPNTPLLTEEVKFTNNYAYTYKHYWKKVHCMNKCVDVTPKKLNQIRSKIDYKSVLFIVKGGIGDCLWVMPAIKKLKQKNPNCYIFVISEEKSKAIWQNCQYINGVALDNTWNTLNVIRKAEQVYDFAGVATIFKDQMKFDPVEAIFRELKFKIPKEKREMRPDIAITVDEGMAATQYLLENNIDTKKDKIVTIGIDASTSNRHYPIAYIKEVSEGLIEKGYKVVWLGKSEEFRKDLLKKDYMVNGVANFVCKTSLREAMAFISLSDLHVNPNSGLLVISTALNIPTIGLFGAFEPKIRCKFYERFKAMYMPVKCSPCNEHWTECRHGHPAPCMKNILPSVLFRECIEMIEKYPRTLIEKLPIQ